MLSDFFSFLFDFIPRKYARPSSNKVDAIYVPSLALSKDRSRLTIFGKQGVDVAVSRFKKKQGSFIVFSEAFKGLWKKEMELKFKITDASKIPRSKILHCIPGSFGATDTYTEIFELRKIIRQYKISSILVVAEYWHMPRVMKALSLIIPECKTYPCVFHAKKHEVAETILRFKGYFTLTKSLWIIYNVILYVLTPIFASSFEENVNR